MKPSSLCNGVVEFLPTQWPMASSQLSRIRLQVITNRCEKLGLIGTFSLKLRELVMPAWKDHSLNYYMGMKINVKLLPLDGISRICIWLSNNRYYRCKVGLIGTFSLKFEGMVMPFTIRG